MRFDDFHKAALTLPGAALDIKWGSERVYCVGGKMFAVADEVGQEEPRYAFKASDLAFEMLVEQGVAIPAPYLASAKWVKLVAFDALPDEELVAYLGQAHALIAAKLTRKLRTELGLA